MKTRIIWTKIYEDSWFITLNPEEKYIFIYIFTNQRIGHTGIYYLPDRILLFETGISPENLKIIEEKFEKAGKVFSLKIGSTFRRLRFTEDMKERKIKQLTKKRKN